MTLFIFWQGNADRNWHTYATLCIYVYRYCIHYSDVASLIRDSQLKEKVAMKEQSGTLVAGVQTFGLPFVQLSVDGKVFNTQGKTQESGQRQGSIHRAKTHGAPF